MKTLRRLARFFDKLEDVTRARLSHHPILYTFIGGIGIVLFWKGIWETAETFPALHGIPSVILSLVFLLPTGLFVSFFIGDNIILSGYKREKKVTEQTEAQVRAEKDAIGEIATRLTRIENEILAMRNSVAEKQNQ